MQDETLSSLVTIHQNIPLADSREIAKRLDIDHRSFFKLVTEYQKEIEADFGVLRFQITKPPKGSRGGRPERYALLTEDQTYTYMSYSQNTEAARKCKRQLVKAFMEAKELLKQRTSLTPLADRLAATVEQIEDQIPDLFFAMATETHREVRHAEFLNQLDQDATAFPEISVGRLWAKHVREDLGIDTKNFPTYTHTGPGLKKEVLPRCYPMFLLKEFRRWFREDYLPNHCPIYIANRKKRVERQSRVENRSNTKRVVGGN